MMESPPAMAGANLGAAQVLQNRHVTSGPLGGRAHGTKHLAL